MREKLLSIWRHEGVHNHRQIFYTHSLLSIATYIRDVVESTGGETSVVVCGGRSLASTTRNKVASVSDKRAAHKGTQAQGIRLFVEEYSL
jgi:hypothetical protein